MGRYNNRRTQQAAQSMQNTPARARFSNNKNVTTNKKNRTNNNNNNNNNSGRNQGGRGGGRGGRSGRATNENNKHQTTTKATATLRQNVVQKITNRVENKQQEQQNDVVDEQASLVLSKGKSSNNTIMIDLDEELYIPDDAIERITNVLQNLNIIQTCNNNNNNEQIEDDKKNDENYYNNDENENYYNNNNGGGDGYVEYDDDYNDEEKDEGDDDKNNNSNKDPTTTTNIIDNIIIDPKIENYLTKTLSFQKSTILRAIHAIQNGWSGSSSSSNSTTNATTTTTNNNINKITLSNILDWICLHIPEKELEISFRQQQQQQQQNKQTNLTNINSKSSISYTAIPHPSISLANNFTNELIEWEKQTQLEQRVLEFLIYGFTHSEIINVLNNNDDNNNNNNDSWVIVQKLLTNLEIDLGYSINSNNTNSDNNVIDNDNEQGLLNVDDNNELLLEQEREALVGIYEENFIILQTDNNSIYKITFDNDNDDNNNNNNNNIILYVLLRPKVYPMYCPPLFLVHATTTTTTNSINNHTDNYCNHQSSSSSSLWAYSRYLTIATMKEAKNVFTSGEPIIFEIITYLNENLSTLHQDFVREQNTKEFNQKQNDIRKQVGHEIVDDEYDYDGQTNIGRRQRARQKGLQKAYNNEEKHKQDIERRKRLQEERLIRVQKEDKDIRSSLAQRTILQREQEQHNEEIRKLSRAAMNTAFINGATIEQARDAAKKAEQQYRITHDLNIDNDDGSTPDNPQNNIGTTIETAATTSININNDNKNNVPKVIENEATPTTIAFMERLRSLYSQAKGGYELLDISPNDVDDDNNTDELPLRHKDNNIRPCPIATPVGDVATIMEELVVSVQKDQPWLIAPDARVPMINRNNHDSTSNIIDLSMMTDRQKQINKSLQQQLRNSIKNPSKSVQIIREQNSQLPAYQMRDTIIETIRSNQITLITASTGAGKTTIVPGLILNDMIERGFGCNANIWVTQPRRISAIGVAERIASERGEKVGETCGYSIKLEKKCSKKTRITLCTTGILLRRLQCDPDLANISHLIIDEVHERDVNSDFALIILKELLQRRKSLKLILMSATFDKDVFASYFKNCASVDIPGRAFEVKEYRLEDILQLTGYEVTEGSDYAVKRRSDTTKMTERPSKTSLRKRYYPKYSSSIIHSLSLVDESIINYELLAALLEHLTLNGEEGAILVFMPGLGEIVKAIEELRKKELFQSDDKVVIYPLHSSLTTSEQTKVFEIPPEGVRKIVVSTNIAETSITVSDVLYVVDSGRVKENRRDEIKDAPALVDCWVSKASAQQRRGRAGRVRPGYSYHMFSSHTFEMELNEYQLPEISRIGIEELILQVLILDLGEPSSFLAKAITPPSANAMKSSLNLLEELGAVECQWQNSIDSNGSCANLKETKTELTALGYHLATLPVEPRIGKLIIYGALFQCVEPALTLAASMASKSPFVSPFGNREAADEARKSMAVENSDHLTVLAAFDKWKQLRFKKNDRALNSFLHNNFLSRTTLFQIDELRKQFCSLLIDIGFLSPNFRLDSSTRNGDRSDFVQRRGEVSFSLFKAILCAGLYPNIVVAPKCLVDGSSKQAAGEMAFRSRNKGDTHLHPSTLLFEEKKLEYRYLCFREIMQTSKLYIRDATVVSPFSLLLFGGSLRVFQKEDVAVIDGWLRFRISSKRSATMIKHLRSQMESMLLRKIIAPDHDSDHVFEREAIAMIEAISTLLEAERISLHGVDAGRKDGAEIVRPWRGPEKGTQKNHESRGFGGRGRSKGGRGRGRGRGRRE